MAPQVRLRIMRETAVTHSGSRPIGPLSNEQRARTCALRWSTNTVHSPRRRPPRLEQKALQAKGF